MKIHQPVAHLSFETSLGMMRLAASVQGLSGAWFVQGQKDCPDISGWGEERSDHEVLAQAMCEINDFLGESGIVVTWIKPKPPRRLP